MGTWIAEQITCKLIASSVIEEGDGELYCYGFFLLITRFFFFLVTAITGFLAGVLFESVVFYGMFMLLRTYAGGVHAKTEGQCTVLTTITLSASILGIKVMGQIFSMLVPLAMLTFGSISISLLSPLDTQDKPLDESEKKYYRLICLILVALCIIFAMISRMLRLNTVYYPIVAGVFLEGVLLCIGKVVNYQKTQTIYFSNHQ